MAKTIRKPPAKPAELQLKMPAELIAPIEKMQELLGSEAEWGIPVLLEPLIMYLTQQSIKAHNENRNKPNLRCSQLHLLLQKSYEANATLETLSIQLAELMTGIKADN